MKLILKVVGTILILLFIAGVVEKVNSKSSKKVFQIGNQQVAIPGNTVATPVAVLTALLKQTAYRPWYQHCMVAQLERVMTPAEQKEYGELPKAEQEAKTFAFIQSATPNCEHSTRQIVNPNATHTELDLIRESSSKSVVLVLKHEHASVALQECASEQIGNATDAQLVTLANGTEKEKTAVFEAVFGPCHGK